VKHAGCSVSHNASSATATARTTCCRTPSCRSGYQRALGSARGWVYTVVRHRALDMARRAGREIGVGDDIEAIADARQQIAPPEQAFPDAAALDRCLDQLDERKREAIVCAFVEGCTHDQIAAQLSTPVGTVKSWIRRGLLALKDCLS
jgi:RNA polymerase sigma-70 factor (ECF subfamily)